MEDLDAAKLDDVKDWFQTYYGPSNAVLVIAGDIDAKTAQGEGREVLRRHSVGPAGRAPGRVDRQADREASAGSCRIACRRRGCTRYGTCPSGARRTPTISRWPRPCSAPASRPGSTSGWCTTSRSRPTWTPPSTLREIGGLFSVEAGVRPGVDPAKVERAVKEELARFLASGPTAVELARAKTLVRADFIRGRRADRRLRRQIGCARQGSGLRGPARLLQGPAVPDRGSDRGAGARAPPRAG